MLRRFSLIMICLTIVLLSTTAFAAESRVAAAVPTLSFNSTTATCEVRYISVGKSISINMELWSGNVLVASWSKTGTSVVTFSEECNVSSGKTYTLKVSGTCDGESFTCIPITKTCP